MPSLSPFDPSDLTSGFLLSLQKQLKAQEDTQRIKELTQYRDFYEGGLATSQDKYVKKHFREEEDAYIQRVSRMTTANICKPVVRAITTAMYGKDPTRHVAKRSSRKRREFSEDKRLQEIITNAQYGNVIKQATRRASIFGTDIVGPWFNPKRRRVEFRTRNIESVYPISDDTNGQDLIGLYLENIHTDRDTGEKYLRVEFWSDDSYGIWRNLRLGDQAFYPDPEAGYDYPNPGPNPYGLIPWATFRAEPDLDEGTWWGLSDIRDVSEINLHINELLSILDMNIHDQGWSQLVLKGYPDNVDALNIGRLKAISIPSGYESGGGAEYIVPNLLVESVMLFIDRLHRLATEGANVPLGAIRTYGEAKSGVSIELEIKPLLDMAGDRQERYCWVEGDLLKLALIVDDVHTKKRVFSVDQAREFTETWEATVEWPNDMRPTDIEKEIARDQTLFEMKIVDPLRLTEKYNALNGQTAESRHAEIAERYNKMEPDDPAPIPAVRTAPGGPKKE